MIKQKFNKTLYHDIFRQGSQKMILLNNASHKNCWRLFMIYVFYFHSQSMQSH